MQVVLSTPCLAIAQGIVAAIQANNPGRPIAAAKVLGFATRQDANAFMLGVTDRVLGALHFSVDPATPTAIGFALQANTTVSPTLHACLMREWAKSMPSGHDRLI